MLNSFKIELFSFLLNDPAYNLANNELPYVVKIIFVLNNLYKRFAFVNTPEHGWEVG